MSEVKRKNSLSLALFASMFKVSLGLISYPLFLKFLDSFDLSVYLLFISTVGFVELLDLNFSSNLVRYFSYADAGVKTLNLDNHIISNDYQERSNLLSDLFMMARQYYRYLCFIAFVTFGIGFSVYLYYFSALHHKNFIYYEANWLVYMSATLLGIYFSYLFPVLIGQGYVDRVNRVTLISKITAVVIQSLLVYFIGLPAIVLGALISMAVERFLLLKLLSGQLSFLGRGKVEKHKFYALLRQFWGTNYKLAIVGISVTIVMRFKFFAAGFAIYNADMLAEFLFSVQVFSLVYMLGTVPISNNYSDMSVYFIRDRARLKKLFLKHNRISLFIILFCSGFIILFGDLFAQLIKAKNTFLPWKYLLLIAVINIFETQLNNNVSSLVIQNKIDMFKAYIISSLVMVFAITIFCFGLHLQIWGLLLSQLIVQGLYNYWYWVKYNIVLCAIPIKDYLLSLFYPREAKIS